DLLYAFTQGLKKIIHLYFLYLFHKFFCTYLWFVIKRLRVSCFISICTFCICLCRIIAFFDFRF
ncbi:hypothetical protein F6D80_09000, partial [Campylobacter coli]|nr:hypothetical protein [Campylobacter coli]EAL0148776.1 hypothetical protein [Campylobacter coli]ECK2781972.1 hypothetical protein [Campylobacter coli]ECX4180031.1 hypothetical protein [Campylobacter coli]